MKKYKVVTVATSSRTRGGITSVINAYRQSTLWTDWNMVWIETHIDRSKIAKLWILIKGLFIFLYHLPSANLIHLHFSEPVSAVRKLLFVFLTKLFHKKLLVHFHAFSTNTTIHGRVSFVYKYIFRNADKIIVLSNYWREEIAHKWPYLTNKIMVIYNPCTQVKPMLIERQNAILFAGTVNQRKGYQDLIKAFAAVKDDHPNWKLVFAGNGEIEAAKQLAKTLQIDTNVEFLGWVSGSSKDMAFRQSSIFCLPSYAEGLPMAMLDAFSYGLPVITTPVGGIPDLLTDSQNALIYQPGDIRALSHCLTKCISDLAVRNSLAESSFKMSATTLNLTTITKELASIYQQMLA
ncbi:glycosyltransferase family 4 protein [Salmonirosea aquatica]|uniref:Glycosyltransferase n=1 Tax=Salmonirosea aquatica TaxID=2654236 RepID=A0A7C9FEV1_9BACT|nr:glycosyltransferase [Cytophagaceae bacterium SJW1-29]